MAAVNPPSALRTPPKLKGDPSLRSYFEQIEFILYQLANRTGGQVDNIYKNETNIANNATNIANIETEVASELTSVSSGQLDALADTLEQIEDRIPISIVKEFYAAKKSAAYTAVDSDYIEANNRAIITLDPNADLNDQIIIANGDGSKITVMGNIKYTRLDSSLISRAEGDSFHFQNFGGYWRIR